MRQADRGSIVARGLLLGALACLGLGGCQAYELQGVVVAGPATHVEVVNADDPRLLQPGVPEVAIDLTLDPASLNPKAVGGSVSGETGGFSIPIRETGVGFLEFELGVTCQYKGKPWLTETLPLPSSKKRLLIILGQSPGSTDLDPDILKNTIQTGNDLLNKH